MPNQVTHESIFIVGLPKRGRPRAAEPGVSVKTWLRESEYDKLIRLASERREPVSHLVRGILIASDILRATK